MEKFIIRNKKSSGGNKKLSVEKNKIISILTRYLVVLSLMFSLPIIYKIFTPLTIISTSKILGLFYNIKVVGDLIIYNSYTIQIIAACVAGSAYLLLLILNLTTQIKLKKRIYFILFTFILFFIINILRIVILSVLVFNDSPLFDITHKLFWYMLSTLFVVAIWFFAVKIFKIKEIPVYNDIKYLYLSRKTDLKFKNI
ncbi:MAG: pacearchaeosortase [Nanoarchaeota archaeon]